MIEGSGSRSVPPTNTSGSGSRRPKIIRIRIRNTGMDEAYIIGTVRNVIYCICYASGPYGLREDLFRPIGTVENMASHCIIICIVKKRSMVISALNVIQMFEVWFICLSCIFFKAGKKQTENPYFWI